MKNNTFIKCYQNITGYYLDNDQYFKKCYQSCELCEIEGNISNHNCIKCNSEYSYELNISSYLNCYKKCEFNFFYDENNQNNLTSSCSPDNNCSKYFYQIFSEKEQCVNDCTKFPNYPLESLNTCYNLYPLYISDNNGNKEYYCKIKCPTGLENNISYDILCSESCSLLQINNTIYKFNNKNIDEQEKMVANIRGEIIKGINTSELDNGEDIIIYGEDANVTITKNRLNPKYGISRIDLGECETKLKNDYNISQNESLYMLKMDVKQDGYNIPKIEYEVYYPINNDSKLHLLNLSNCEDLNINIYLYLNLDGNLEQNDPNSDFYNDICNTYTSENGTDLTLSVRKQNFI